MPTASTAVCARASGADSPVTAPLTSAIVTAATATSTRTVTGEAACSAMKACVRLYVQPTQGAMKGTTTSQPAGMAVDA